jgi:tetrapyrrole methylase family protein/MazG family protein
VAGEKILDRSVAEILELIITLRGEAGCPWDRKQTASSISVYLIEEMYELVEALAADHTDEIIEELGDTLFQLLFLVRLFEEQKRFLLPEVVSRNLEKMIRRHPHVFGSDKVESAGEVKKRWREIKQQEKGKTDSLLDNVPAGMPALMRAYRISERAAAAGFDWNALPQVISQAEAEWKEFKDEIGEKGRPTDLSRAALEFGDVLFTLINVGRMAGIHPETALSQATQKFINRFKRMESKATQSQKTFEALPRDQKELLWQEVKKAE